MYEVWGAQAPERMKSTPWMNCWRATDHFCCASKQSTVASSSRDLSPVSVAIRYREQDHNNLITFLREMNPKGSWLAQFPLSSWLKKKEYYNIRLPAHLYLWHLCFITFKNVLKREHGHGGEGRFICHQWSLLKQRSVFDSLSWTWHKGPIQATKV